MAPYTLEWTVKNLHDQQNPACEKQTWLSVALSLVRLDIDGAWLACLAINWISVIVSLSGFGKST